MKKLNIILAILLLFGVVFAVDVPSVKTLQTFTGQTSADNTVTIFTPAVTGLYRISIYTEYTVSLGNITAEAHFTGAKGTSTSSVTCQHTNDVNASSCVLLIRSLANDSVSLEVLTGNSSPTYDLYVVAELLE